MAPRKRKADIDGAGGDSVPHTKTTKKTKRTIPSSTSMRITRNMVVDGPRKAVFTTAELLESILLHLPPKTIFGVQRVCRQFRDVVATSTNIQQQLFLRSSSAMEKETWVIVRKDSRIMSHWPPPYKFVRLPNPDSDLPSNVYVGLNDSPKRYSVCNLNPLLQHDSSASRDSTIKRVWPVEREPVLFDIKGTLAKASATAASWKRTFLTEPPCRRATVEFDWTIKSKPNITGHVRVDVHDPAGLTLGALWEGAMDQDEVEEDVEKGFSNVHSYWTTEPWVNHQHHGTLHEMFEKLEKETGKKAYLMSRVSFWLDGVLFPSQKEKRSVTEA